MRRLLLAVAALLCAHTAHAATKYVNQATGHDIGGCGASTSPCASFQFAVYQSKPGDDWLVYNGTYRPVQINHSGIPSQYITFEAAPGQHPVVVKDGTAWSGIAVRDNMNYLIIKGFTVLGNAQSITYGQAAVANTTNYTTNGSCIGIPKTSHHIQILNNDTEYCPGSGIQSWGDYMVIAGNTVCHNAYWSHLAESGIAITSANPTTPPGTVLVYRNYVCGNIHYSCDEVGANPVPCFVSDGNGIIVDTNNADGTNYAGRVKIYNNVIYNNGGWGLVCVRCQHVDIYNNTTYGNGVSATLPAPYTASGGESAVGSRAAPYRPSNDVRVENNIFMSTLGTPTMNFNTAVTTNFTEDYNIYYGGPQYGPVSAHDLPVNPGLALALPPPDAFRLTPTSLAIGSGEGTLIPVNDFANVPRSPSRHDRGAYKGP